MPGRPDEPETPAHRDADPSAAIGSLTPWRLAEAYRRRGEAGDTERSRLCGMQALRGGVQDDDGYAARFAGWMLADGRAAEAFEALEVAAMTPGGTPAGGPDAAPPTVAEVAAALRAIGAGALVYLHPTDEHGRMAGVLRLDPAAERVDVVGTVPVDDPLTSDGPGWPAVVEPLMNRLGPGSSPHRVLIAATGALGRLALPAVRTRSGRRLAQDMVVSQVASGGEVVRLACRTPRPVAADPVFVINPRGDREPATLDVMPLRRAFYARSTVLGRVGEPAQGTGTPGEVLAHLPASMLHLACGLRTGGTVALELADGTVLDVAAIRESATTRPEPLAGGLVVLARAAGHEHFVAMADALLAAGCTGVAGWLWPVPETVAALALYLLHAGLIDDGLAPAMAVGAVQRWMADPDRVVPAHLPGHFGVTMRTTDLAQPGVWAALTYRGR